MSKTCRHSKEWNSHAIVSHTETWTLTYTATHCNAPQHTAIHCPQHKYLTRFIYIHVPAVRCSTYSATHCKTRAATHCKALQHAAVHINLSCRAANPSSISVHNTLQHTATYCNRLQQTATDCNILLHTATRIPELICSQGVIVCC